jgi:hypothetical protein
MRRSEGDQCRALPGLRQRSAPRRSLLKRARAATGSSLADNEATETEGRMIACYSSLWIAIFVFSFSFCFALVWGFFNRR